MRRIKNIKVKIATKPTLGIQKPNTFSSSDKRKIKEQAYKEFAEALRKHYDSPVWYLGGSNGFFDNLDSFVKEMVGEEE